jgi:HK97 family phage major capsid protein
VLHARKFALLGRVSSELAADSPSFAQQFKEALVAAAAFHIDDSLLNSNGGSEPEGLLNAPCLIAVPKETAQAAASVIYENIVNMWSRMFPPSRNNSIWVANSDVIPQLFTMSQTVGTGGVPVFEPASQPAATLFGRPIIFTEKLPSLGTEGDIMLLDLSQYAVGLRADVKLMISPSVYFTTDELAFRLTMRIDGKSLWDRVLTPTNGPTLSPFVALATRA